MADQDLTHYELRALTEAVRLHETGKGALDDTDAITYAKRDRPDFEARVISRALFLAQKNGLLRVGDEEPGKLPLGAKAILLLLSCSLGVLMGRGIGVGGENTINALGLVLVVLVSQVIGIAAWLMSFRFKNRGWPSLFRFLEGQLRHWLKGREFELLRWQARAILDDRHSISHWRVGTTVHASWAALALGLLVTIALIFALHRFDFVVGSTIVKEEVFAALVTTLGSIPSYLGFPLPADGEIQQALGGMSGSADSRWVWGWWIIGVLLVWAFIPRLMLFSLSHWVVAKREARVSLNLSDPYYQRLRSLLLPERAESTVVDPEIVSIGPSYHVSGARGQGGGSLVVGLEITDSPWPLSLLTKFPDGGVVTDGRDQSRLREQLTQEPPAQLLVVCNADISPDRGTLKLVGEFSEKVDKTGVLLFQHRGDVDNRRLNLWRSAIIGYGIEKDRVFAEEEEALKWMEAR